MKFVVLLALVVGSFSGCTYALHEYHAGDIEQAPGAAPGRTIEVQTDQFVFLSFVFNTDYVDRAFSLLEKKCPQGKVTGIHTRYSTNHSFLSYRNVIKMTATCVRL